MIIWRVGSSDGCLGLVDCIFMYGVVSSQLTGYNLLRRDLLTLRLT